MGNIDPLPLDQQIRKRHVFVATVEVLDDNSGVLVTARQYGKRGQIGYHAGEDLGILSAVRSAVTQDAPAIVQDILVEPCPGPVAAIQGLRQRQQRVGKSAANGLVGMDDRVVRPPVIIGGQRPGQGGFGFGAGMRCRADEQ